MTKMVKAKEEFYPFGEPQHEVSRQLMYAVIGDIVFMYEDHDHPRYFKMCVVPTGQVFDITIDTKFGTIEEFMREHYERGAHRSSMGDKVVEQSYCPECKHDGFYYLSFRRTCTEFGQVENKEIHIGLCTKCNHFERFKKD